MSDRHKGYIVILGEDLKDEDSEQVINAITLIKGVLEVKPVINNVSDTIAHSRVRRELGEKLFNILYPTDKTFNPHV